MESKTAITKLIEALRADKTMVQPYKNYALSDALRLEAVIEKGLGTTMRKPPEDMVITNPQVALGNCICTPGQKPAAHCPVHGLSSE